MFFLIIYLWLDTHVVVCTGKNIDFYSHASLAGYRSSAPYWWRYLDLGFGSAKIFFTGKRAE